MAKSIWWWLQDFLFDRDAKMLKTLLTLNSAAMVAVIGLAGGVGDAGVGSGIGPTLLIFASGAVMSLLGLPWLAVTLSAHAESKEKLTHQENAARAGQSEFEVAAHSEWERLVRTTTRLSHGVIACTLGAALAFFLGIGVVTASVW